MKARTTARIRGAGGSGSAGGFTIVEVLMVVAIMVMLFGMVIIASKSIWSKRDSERTRAMISTLQIELQEYKSLKGHYPPDGYDSEVKNAQGTRIRGSACLYEFLGKEFTVENNVGGQLRIEKHDPLIAVFKKDELSPEDPDNPGAFEILDGFGLPYHYDNTEDGQFKPEAQQDLPHLQAVENHPVDPRTDTEVVPRVGIQNMGNYDLWSHGNKKAHDEPVPVKETIGTWNMDMEKKSQETKT
jgi:type II secretory pathway pseudopilin PulG